MKKFRKLVFWMHLVAGVVAGVIIFVMSVTGALLANEKQIATWADGYRISPSQSGASRLPIETLLTKISEHQSDAQLSGITLRSDPTMPLTIALGRDKNIFINPYTGEVLGEGAKKTRAFFHLMTDWHRWLGTSEQGRAVGRAITGWCNLAFLFLVASGIYLWWPRNWSAPSLKAITFFARGLRGKARDWNWHNTIGFWSAIPLFFIVLGAVFISFPWANNFLYRITGNEPPPPQQRSGGQAAGIKISPRGGVDDQNKTANREGLNRAFEIAEQKVAGWKTITLRLSPAANAPLVFSIDSGNGGRPDLRSQLTLDSKTGEVTRWETFESYNVARQIRSWGRYIHTGEAGGIIGQMIAGIASIGAAVLVWTGLALAWRRFLGRKDKQLVQNKPSIDVTRVPLEPARQNQE